MKKILSLLFVIMLVLVLSNSAMAFFGGGWDWDCGGGCNDDFNIEECPEFECPWEDPVTVQGNTAEVTQAGKLGEVYLYQTGDKNFAMVNQYGSGPKNMAIIDQVGYALNARVFQGGKHNEAHIVQRDILQKATVRQPGNHNYAYVEQSF